MISTTLLSSRGNRSIPAARAAAALASLVAGFAACGPAVAPRPLSIPAERPPAATVAEPSCKPESAADAEVVLLQAGPHRTCSVHADGRLCCWGWQSLTRSELSLPDDRGEWSEMRAWPLGGAGSGESVYPRRVSLPAPAAGVALGGAHSCIWTRAGQVACWGNNGAGQMGDPTYPAHEAATVVPGLENVRLVRANDLRTCVLRLDGGMRCWGERLLPSTGPLLFTASGGVAGLSMSIGLECALHEGGTFGCGGTRAEFAGSMKASGGLFTMPGLNGVAELAATKTAMCARLEGGAVTCWSHLGEHGSRVDDGHGHARTVPREIAGLRDVAQLVAGDAHFCALGKQGDVRCWGDNGAGQLGDGTNVARATPVAASLLGPVKQLTAGPDHTCALGTDGALRCWGRNDAGQLGDGTRTDRALPAEVVWSPRGTPPVAASAAPAPPNPCEAGRAFVQGKPPPELRSLALGRDKGCVAISDGSVRCWGESLRGAEDALAPRVIVADGFQDVARVALIDLSMCALDPRGSMKCMGLLDAPTGAGPFVDFAFSNANLGCGVDSRGQVACWGRGFAGSASPRAAVRIALGKPAVQVIGNCAVTSDGGAWCWDLDTKAHGVRALGPFSGPVDRLALGHGFGCALLRSREVACWGAGMKGELGGGALGDRKEPAIVPGLKEVVEVEAARDHVCARTATGEVFCWGAELLTRAPSPSPARVAGLGAAADVAVGPGHACASTREGVLCCWGHNEHGQLGDNTRQPSDRPVPVVW